MRKLWILGFCLVSSILSAQKTGSIQVLTDNPSSTVIDVTVGEITSRSVHTPRGEAKVISIENGSPVLNAGAPSIPSLSFSVIIPDQHTATLNIRESQFIDYPNYEVAPSKGKMFRTVDPLSVPYSYGKEYTENAFYPSSLARVQNAHTLRDFNGETVKIYPVQYNPVSKTLRVYTHLKVELTYEAMPGAVYTPRPTTVDETYDLLYKRHFINYQNKKTRYSPIKQTGSMLIVCPGNYLSAMQPFIEWKNKKGIPILVCNTDTLSGGVNTNSLNAVAKYYYQTKHIAYMLLVGDHAQIPAANSLVPWVSQSFGECSDWVHAYISNNDHYPEFLVGRFSGESEQDIITQVNRTINYEKYPNISTNWYQKQIGIASQEGDIDSDDGQLDYEHICDITDSNRNQYHYVNSKGYFDGTHNLCNDDIGYPMPIQIQDEINSGIGLINYCGHGTLTSFPSSGFSTNEIPNLTNTYAHPFIFSTACFNGTFMNGTCLGEAFLRSKNSNGQPTGALAVLMSSIEQSWNPPMEGQDEMNAVMRGARSNNIRTTYGAIVGSGLMALMDKYNDFADPDGGNEVADTWLIFGDPSVEVKTNHEGTITCQHMGFLQQGNTIFYVMCPVEGATVSLFYQKETIATGIVQGGMATLYFNPVNVLDSISVTATKQNWAPYFGRVDVVNYPVSTSQFTQEGISIYPNPASDELQIQCSTLSEWTTLEVRDVTGRLWKQETMVGPHHQVSLSGLAVGNYILTLHSQNKTIQTRFNKW